MTDIKKKGIAGVFIGILLYISVKIRLFGLLFDRAEIDSKDDWTKISASPEGGNKYPPQGMAAVEDELFITNHYNGEKSVLYRVDPEDGRIKASVNMPTEAKHTSGLAWDNEYLWAVDHECNKLYKIDVAATFEENDIEIVEEMDTGLRASSGLTLMEIDGKDYAAVSDFLWTIETDPPLPLGSSKTYIAPTEDLWDGDSFKDVSKVSYANGGYSQGLTWDGKYLYESLNNVGTNRVELLDVSEAVKNSDSDAVECVGSFEGPSYFIEDIDTDGESMWTTDEVTYNLYRFDSLSDIRQQYTT